MRISKKLKSAFQVLIGLALGVAVGVGFAILTDEPGVDPNKAALKERFGIWLVVFAILLAILYAFFVVAIHELGHIAGGLIARFRFHFLIIGPIRFDRDDHDRIRFAMNRDLSFAGGIAGMLPTDTVDLQRRLFLLVAGGPLASLLLAVAAYASGHELLRVLALMSFAIFIIAMIPMRSGGMATDGARLIRLMSKGPNAKREAAVLPLLGLASSGTPPREWPSDLVQAGIGTEDGSVEEYNGHVMAYYHYADSGDIEQVHAHMQRAIALSAHVPPMFRPALNVEAAYYKARYENDPVGARALLESVPPKGLGVKGYEIARVQAAIALAEGKTEEAKRIASEALSKTPERDSFTRAALQQIAQ